MDRGLTMTSRLQTGWGMKARIEGERLLQPDGIGPRRNRADEDQVPAMRRNRARDEDELVLGEQGIAEGLLPGAGYTWPQPVGIGNGIDDTDA